MKRTAILGSLALALAIGFGLGAGMSSYGLPLISRGWAIPASEVPVKVSVPDTAYGAQKVVYHVSNKGNWRDREAEAWRLVSVLNNHINAIEPEDIDLRVIFQGDGVDALQRAKVNPTLGAAFDALRKRGVKLRICANTLEAYRVLPDTLHGVKPEELVRAAVAELAHLQQQGFVYIKF